MATPRNRGRPRATDPSLSSTVFEAAMSRFARMGFDGASLRDIAGDAAVDVALVSYQFGSKLLLWQKIVQTVGRQLLDHLHEVEALNASRPAGDRLRAALVATLDFLIASPMVPRFILRDLSHNAEREAWMRQEVTLPLFEHLRGLADEAAGPGAEQRGHSAFAIANFIYAAAGAVARREQLATVIPDLERDDAFRAALEDVVLRPVLSHG